MICVSEETALLTQESIDEGLKKASPLPTLLPPGLSAAHISIVALFNGCNIRGVRLLVSQKMLKSPLVGVEWDVV